MVLTLSRYLNWFQSYSFFNIDMSKFFTNTNHDDVRRHDSSKLVNTQDVNVYDPFCSK